MSEPTTLGTIIKRLRRERNWKLADMSAATGIPVSTLSKIENDKLTLSYDKLQHLSRALSIPLAALFAEDEEGEGAPVVTARRSIASLDRAVKIETNNYDYYYFCSDLRHRKMIPILTRVTAKTLDQFGELVRHSGEEFVYVTEGSVDLHTDFYAPQTLGQGEGVYIDSNMGHAYVLTDGYEAATMLVVCASGAEDLAQELIAEAEARPPVSALQPATRVPSPRSSQTRGGRGAPVRRRSA